MKDFDFDELDRAVSSVLTKTKPINDDQPPTDGAASVPHDTPHADGDGPAQAVQVQTGDSQPAQTDNDADGASDQPTDSQSLTTESSDVLPQSLPDVPMLSSVDNEATAPADNPQSEPTEHDEPHHEQPAPDDTPASDPEPADAPTEHAEVEHQPDSPADDNSSEASEPAAEELTHEPLQQPKRGRFMDMVHPSADMKHEQKPMPTRSGVTLQPSHDFSVEQPVDQPAAVDTPAAPQPQLEEEVTEPPTSSEQAAAATELAESADGADTPIDTPDEQPSEAPSPADTPTSPVPFIPDVPVEKRPLNPTVSAAPHEDTPAADATTPDISSADEQIAAQTPREFAPDVMAVEANETVGESVAAPVVEPTTAADPAASGAAAPAVPADAAQPVFDANSYHQPLVHTKPKTSKTLWLMIALILFLVGAALGVLYFLYAQQ